MQETLYAARSFALSHAEINVQQPGCAEVYGKSLEIA